MSMLSDCNFGPAPPYPAPFNMARYVLAQGALGPDLIALRVLSEAGGTEMSYAALIGAVQGVATGLRASGLTPGARVLMRLGNTPDFPIAYLGCIAAGLVAIATSSQLTVHEITKMAQLVQPAAILQDPELSAPKGADAASFGLDELRHWQAQAAPDDGFAYDMGDPNRPAYIVFTSGTSGTPRAVVHAHRAIWARRMMHEGWYGLKATDRLLHAGAFNWTFTLGTGLMDPWTLGATALIPEAGTPTHALARLMAREEASIFAAAPGVLRKMLQSDMPALPALRHVLSAGEKLPEATRAAWGSATGTEVFEAFGMSECSTFISANPAAQAPKGSLGRPQQGRRVAILGEDGRPVQLGTRGQIAVHRTDPGLMLGYLAADGTGLAPAEDPASDWFVTGDMGVMQESYAVTYHGRDDDMMNAGGFRVSPLEVEAAFGSIPELRQVAATEVEIKDGVHVIALWYASAAPIAKDVFEALATARLARYKRPRVYMHRCALPVSANGKLLRRALRAEYEEHHGQT